MSNKKSRWSFRTQELYTLLPYLNKFKDRLILGSIMVVLTNIAAVISPWILRAIIDDLSLQVNQRKLLLYSGLIVCFSILEGFFRFLMRRILIGLSRRIEFDLRNDLYAHLQKLSPSFYKIYSTGDLMARSSSDLAAVRSVLGPGIMYSLNNFRVRMPKD